jgi:transposase-like protein
MSRRQRREIIRGDDEWTRGKVITHTTYRIELLCPRCDRRDVVTYKGRFDSAPRHTCTGCGYNGPMPTRRS